MVQEQITILEQDQIYCTPVVVAEVDLVLVAPLAQVVVVLVEHEIVSIKMVLMG